MTIQAQDYQGMSDDARDAEHTAIKLVSEAMGLLRRALKETEIMREPVQEMIARAPSFDMWHEKIADARRAE